MRNVDPTIQPEGYIEVYDPKERRPVKVQRLSQAQRAKCKHKWGTVFNQGHGAWRNGCLLCGALAR